MSFVQSRAPVAPSCVPIGTEQAPPFVIRKRIALLGGRGVGKSALTIQCAQNRFEADYMPTFEETYQWTPVIDGINYDVTIVDTDGQDETSFYGLQYTIGIDAYILVFSVRDYASFELLKGINDKLLDTLNVIEPDEIPRILIGNQVDIAHEREVATVVAERFAAELNIPYFETSAMTRLNVNKAFMCILQIVDQNLRYPIPPIQPSITPPPPTPPPQSRQPNQHPSASATTSTSQHTSNTSKNPCSVQ